MKTRPSFLLNKIDTGFRRRLCLFDGVGRAFPGGHRVFPGLNGGEGFLPLTGLAALRFDKGGARAFDVAPPRRPLPTLRLLQHWPPVRERVAAGRVLTARDASGVMAAAVWVAAVSMASFASAALRCGLRLIDIFDRTPGFGSCRLRRRQGVLGGLVGRGLARQRALLQRLGILQSG